MTIEEKPNRPLIKEQKWIWKSAINRGVVKVPNAAVDSAFAAGLAPTSAAEKKGKGIREDESRV